MAEFNLSLKINGIETAVASVEDLESALKATKEEMNTLQIGSEAFNVAAANAQKLDSALKNVKLSTEGIDSKQLAGSFAKLGETVTGAFAIATNAISVFGKENEDVAAAAVKAQQAIAIVMGARAVAEGVLEGRAAARLLLEKVGIANSALITSLFGAQATAAAALAVSTGTATTAQIALNVAMEANPILLIVAAIGALVGAFALLADSEETEIERTERLNAEKEKELIIINKVIDAYVGEKAVIENAIQGELDLLKSSNASKTDIYNKEQELLDRKIITLRAIGQSGRDLNNQELIQLQTLQNQKKIVDAQFEQDRLKTQKDERKKATDKALKDAKDEADKLRILKEAAAKEELELRKAQAPTKQALLEIDLQQEIQYLDGVKEASIKAGTDKLVADEIYEKARLDLTNRYQILGKLALDQITDEGEKQRAEELKNVTDFYSRLNNERQINALQGLKGLALIEEKHEQDVSAINAKYAENRKQAKALLSGDAIALNAALAQIDTDYQNAKEQEDIDYSARRKQRQLDDVNQYAQVATSAATDVVNLLSAINDGARQEEMQKINEQYGNEENALRTKLNSGAITRKQYDAQEATLNAKKAKAEYDAKKKAFESDKKLKIAQTIIAGITGALSAFTGAMQLGPIAGPIVGGILATLVGVTTALQVNNINKTKFDGGAPEPVTIDPGAGSDAVDKGDAAVEQRAQNGGLTGFNPNLVNDPTKPQTGTTTSTTPIKVVVLESDISNAQKRVMVGEGSATF